MYKKKDFVFRKAKKEDIKKIGTLYNDLNDFLAENINYSGWTKGIYPTENIAQESFLRNDLFVFELNNQLVGSVILNSIFEYFYKNTKWELNNLSDDKILAIHTLVTSPKYKGLGKIFLDLIKDFGIENNFKSIRLDTSINNLPAINLYEKNGFVNRDKIFLGDRARNSPYFYMFEFIF